MQELSQLPMQTTALIAALIIFVPVLIVVLWWIITVNNFKRKEIKIQEALGGIEVALTKRYDMLTKLLDVTRGYAAHEKELFTEVVELRRDMSIGELNSASGQIDTMASRLFAVAENYPDLRSAEIFRELQAGIRDAEDHLQAARRLYNSNVSAFNTAINMLPASLVANANHLEEHAFFVAEAAKHADIEMKF